METNNITLKTWTSHTIYGWLIGFVCIIILALLLEVVGISDSQFFTGTGIAAGVGFMQNRILRAKLGWNWNWMLMTIIGMTFSFLFFEFGPIFIESLPDYNLQLSVAIGGLLVGILQFFLLRKKSIKRSHWWVLISFIGWGLAGFIVGLTEYMINFIEYGPVIMLLNLILMAIISCLVLGIVTGKGLTHLLKTES